MAWWFEMSLLQQIFFCIAVPTTLIMIIQAIMLAIGMGGDGADGADGMDSGDGDAGIGAFVLRGLIAFFTVGGWAGVWLGSTKMHAALVILIAVLLGAAAFVGMVFLIKGILKLQSDGTLKLENSVGKLAKVYIPVPPSKSGVGKVTLTVQDRLIELDAMTEDVEKLKTDELVKVVSMIDGETALVVRA